MSRLLVSTFIRMLKKVIFWFFVLCMFAYGVYSALNIASEARIGFVLDGCLFECLPLMGLISAIFTSLFIGSEYSDGTIRNKIIVGHSRIRIYLANLIVCAIASVLISLSYTVGVFVIGNMNGGELITETATIFLCMISSLMISVTFASIMTLLAILNTNKAGNVVVSMILALVLLVSGSFIHQKLGEPKLYDNYVTVNEMGIPIYAHILDEDRKVNAQKFETAFYAKPDLRNVRPPEEPAKSEPATLDLESLVEQLQKSPELASALAALIAAQAPAK